MITNGVLNYGNPLGWDPLKNGGAILSNQNLTAKFNASAGQDNAVKCTIGKASGKWYWEIVIDAINPVSGGDVGIMSAGSPVSNNYVGGGTSLQGFGFVTFPAGSSQKWNNATNSIYGTPGYIAGSIIGVAMDMTGFTIGFYVNNVFQGIAYTTLGTTATYYPTVSTFQQGACQYTAHFKASSLVYTPPAGYSALG